MKLTRLVMPLLVAGLAGACASPPHSTASSTALSASTSATPSASTPAAASTPPEPTPSAESSPLGQPSTIASCSSAPTVAAEPLVMLPQAVAAEGNAVEIDGFSDPAHPQPFCVIDGSVYDVTFISATEIGYVFSSSSDDPIGGTTTIQRMSLLNRQPVTVATVQGDVLDVTWSSDGTNVAYIAYTRAPNLDSGDANQLWLKAGDAAPRALTPLIPLFGRDGSVDDENIVRFSQDGRYLLMLDTFVSGSAPGSPDLAMFQVRSVPDGNLVWVPPAALGQTGGKGGPFISWAVWAHLTDRLYYRDPAGVHAWDASSSSSSDLAAGLLWASPSLSTNDQLVAYQIYVNGQPAIQTRNLTSGAVRTLPGLLGYPVLLSTTTVIEEHLEPNTQMGPAFETAGTYVLNLSTGSERALQQMGTPIDIWPH